MKTDTVLVTGTPRSGTTLTCHLLNKLPDTVALHEPMQVKRFATLGGREEICDEIERFANAQRESILEQGRAVSKNVGGTVPDNPVGSDRTSAGLRQSIVVRGEIVVDKLLSPDFMLVIKHNSAFAAILPALVERFPVYGVVRNPLATLASWSSVNFSVQSGHAAAAERLDTDLKAQLAAIDDELDRQIHLLGWFHHQFHRYLPKERIIRYETVIETGGRALRVVRPEADGLREPMQSRNQNRLYGEETVLQVGARLLGSDGPFWESYSRESVQHLLATI